MTNLFGPLKAVIEPVLWFIENFRLAFLGIGLVWFVYFVARLLAFGQANLTIIDSSVKFLDQNQIIINIVGPVCILAVTSEFYWRKRKVINPALKMLASSSKTEMEFGPEIVSEREVQDRLLVFSQDANSIKILAGDADFLNEHDRQHEEIKKRDGNCVILMSKNYRVPVVTLKGLVDSGLRARIYPDDFEFSDTGLRGRLKAAPTGRSACIFDKQRNGFKVIELDNSTLVEMLFNKFDEWYVRGRNPFIRHVVFDLAGVAFDGDIRDFYHSVGTLIQKPLQAASMDYLKVNDDLNLGKIDIAAFIAQKTNSDISDDKADSIRELWSQTWKPNLQMMKLAAQVKQSGYTVSICSNCDRENANHYDVSNYFDVFEHLFLSCDLQVLKPSNELFNRITAKLAAQPYECLFIDDHRDNTDAAAQQGFETLLIPRGVSSSQRDDYVKKHLDRLAIRY